MELTKEEFLEISSKLSDIIYMASGDIRRGYEPYEAYLKNRSEDISLTLNCIKYRLDDIYKIIEKNISDDRKRIYGYDKRLMED